MFESNLKDQIDIKILPMIDVVFFLLVFFMLFTTFKTTPSGLEINLPQAKSVEQQQEDKTVKINIAYDGKIFMNSKLTTIDELKENIATSVNESTETVFVIKADEKVEYKQVINVMDLVRQAGGYRLTLAANKDELN
ncbi:ExbD/TolR family protein [Halanaerobacter jeridensis]|uniref:Biopolymer transport protein ExbD n=1 Tax=Halanaerobacter jeridensis TaxID=706427 RepID=A0A938XNL7_9FIRM|nr:biopolymer transporter ExbD [Halanaerobacter jeridensis]MBM7555988.1 biopolymer transport protein ExbD [Halanaerobacter jeridensis]